MTKPENPPAFPGGYRKTPITEGESHRYEGMTLRDYFAGQALIGILTQKWTEESKYATLIATDAYKFADAMIAERNKNNESKN